MWRQTFGGGAAETATIYDADGHLLAEHDATNGDVQREYIWLDDLPVALLDIAGASVTTGFIHTGQIDELLMVTDAGQAIVWDATVDPYGIATISGMPSTTLDMRLPGLEDALSQGFSQIAASSVRSRQCPILPGISAWSVRRMGRS